MRILAGLLAASLVVATGGVAGGPKGKQELVVVVHSAFLALDTDCNFYRRLENPIRYEFLTQGPVGRPTSLVEEGVGTNHYKLGMANGDVYDVVYSGAVGLSFTFEANVFGGAPSRSWSAVKRDFSGANRR